MSFVSAVRDYVEILNNVSDSLGSDFSFANWLSETFVYILKTIQYFIVYILSFNWIRDFSLLPVVIPQISSSIFRETFFLETPSKVFFEFLEIPSLDQNKFILGLFNSLFLTLPVSVTHIISIRRLLIQGIPAGFFSISGYLLGQCLFLIFVVFGIRELLIPWLTLEPFNYILGLILIFRSIYSMTQENLNELSGWQNPQYRNFFLTSFLLAWCEQSSIFQYLGNLSITPNPTALEGFPTNSAVASFLNHSFYVFGIVVGSFLFTFFWGWFLLQVKKWCIRYTPLFLSSFVQNVNKITFVLTLSFSLSSIPFYGLDYLFTSPLGFISQDRLFSNTLLDQYNIKDSNQLLGSSSNFQSLDVDVSPFDRGRYLIFPEAPQLLSFEDLNYRGEAEWTNRYDKVSGITDSRAGFFTLSKLFKKQKSVEMVSSNKTATDQNNEPKSNLILHESDSSFIDDTSNVGARFNDWYNLKSENQDELSFENTFRDFTNSTFPVDFLRTDSIIEKDIEQKIKQKYYSNPVYKNLLALDIDLFLNRQPKDFRLNGDQELDLFNKRRILSSYYDSLRAYAKLPYTQAFENFFDGSKSFSNKVYNQQFKGTLRSVRRLFSLTIDPGFTENKSTNKLDNKQVLKFDQPLYKFSNNDNFSSYHEELPEFQNSSILAAKQTPFLQEILTRPLYAGWDENLRKFVITNKLLPRNLAGYKINITQEMVDKFSPDFSNNKVTKDKNKRLNPQKIKFTAWPLSNQILTQPTSQSKISYVTLYESKLDPKNENEKPFDLFSSLPANWQTLQRQSSPAKSLDNIFDYLAPKRGGFIWPGNKKLNLPKSVLNFTLN
jgi:hypothetical protein